jgi:magnesium transporter
MEAITQSNLDSILNIRNIAAIPDMVKNWPAPVIAHSLEAWPADDQAAALAVLPANVAADVFAYLPREGQDQLVDALNKHQAADLLNNMAPDDRTRLLKWIGPVRATRLVALLTPENRAVATTLLGYPERSVGRLMTPDYIATSLGSSVQQVLDYVRLNGQDSETITMIYVIDDKGTLIDDIRIRQFLLAPLTAKVADLMDYQFVALRATDPQEKAIAVFQQVDRKALPVIDEKGVLIGIVTIDDVLAVAQAAATNEIQKIGGSEALDEPYLKIALGRLIKKRAGWLVILFLGEMLTATAMGFFEKEIEKAVVLALFVPLIISSGGNAGSQASTLVIRALALTELKLKDWWPVMRREIMTGLALGAILGTIGFFRIAIWSIYSTIYGPHWLLVALTVGLSLVGIVLWGSLCGSMLPFILRRSGFDPATSSTPFVATLVDVTGLIIYFSIGMLILRGTLL